MSNDFTRDLRPTSRSAQTSAWGNQGRSTDWINSTTVTPTTVTQRSRQRASEGGNSRDAARFLGNLSGKSEATWQGTPVTTGAAQFFKFALSKRTQVDLALENLSDNVDLRLLNSRGVQVQASRQGGRRRELIQSQLASGTYTKLN
jgi:hypothetical protein